MQAKTATRSSNLKHLFAATLLLAAGHALAGDFMGEAGISHGSGGKIDTDGHGHRESYFIGGAFGHRFDNGFGVRGPLFGDGDPYRGLEAGDRTFDTFYGVQATAYVPVVQQLNLMGSLGFGQTPLDLGGPGQNGRQTVGDGVISAGPQYRFFRNFAMNCTPTT